MRIMNYLSLRTAIITKKLDLSVNDDVLYVQDFEDVSADEIYSYIRNSTFNGLEPILSGSSISPDMQNSLETVNGLNVSVISRAPEGTVDHRDYTGINRTFVKYGNRFRVDNSITIKPNCTMVLPLSIKLRSFETLWDIHLELNDDLKSKGLAVLANIHSDVMSSSSLTVPVLNTSSKTIKIRNASVIGKIFISGA